MQEQVRKPHGESTSETDLPRDEEKVAETREKLTAEMDDLLDEIDSVLETNDFVKDYVQQSGQ